MSKIHLLVTTVSGFDAEGNGLDVREEIYTHEDVSEDTAINMAALACTTLTRRVSGVVVIPPGGIKMVFKHPLVGDYYVNLHIWDHPVVDGVARPWFCNGSYYVSWSAARKGFALQVAKDMAENALNAGILHVQNACAQPFGDIAGVHFSGPLWKSLVETFTSYVQAEVDALAERDEAEAHEKLVAAGLDEASKASHEVSTGLPREALGGTAETVDFDEPKTALMPKINMAELIGWRS